MCVFVCCGARVSCCMAGGKGPFAESGFETATRRSASQSSPCHHPASPYPLPDAATTLHSEAAPKPSNTTPPPLPPTGCDSCTPFRQCPFLTALSSHTTPLPLPLLTTALASFHRTTPLSPPVTLALLQTAHLPLLFFQVRTHLSFPTGHRILNFTRPPPPPSPSISLIFHTAKPNALR